MRVRKHVNPFNFPREMPKLQLQDLYPHPENPLHLDIGFAQGEFIFKSATANPSWNYLGLEIRTPLVEKLQKQIVEAGLNNLNVFAASSLINLDIIPDNSLDLVTVFFPDPCFKNRHQKRRIINERFLREIPSKLKPSASILFQTDVESLYADTLELIESDAAFVITLSEPGVHHPTTLGVESYFEGRCLQENWPIYRIGFMLIAEVA